MAQFDKLLAAMVSNKADALVLEDGDLVKLEVSGQLRPLTKSPLTGAQIVALLKEIASTEAAKNLDANKPATMSHVTGDGAFVIRAMLHGTKWHVNAQIDDKAEFKRLTGQFKAMDLPPETPPGGVPVQSAASAVMGNAPPAPAAPPAAPPPAAPPTPAPANVTASAAPSGSSSKSPDDLINFFEGIDESRAYLDSLLKMMVEKGASDLHLRVTEPPILRHHGEMARQDGHQPLSDEQLFRMIRSIMPERNRREYAETNDTDYAYELKGVARFRANAARDRNGPVAVFRQIPATVVTVEQMKVTEEVQRLCFLTKGLVLVTGPTGSGKSTTLCALIDLVNRARSDHVITIEDPIEFVHPNKSCIITQRQVHVHTKSFKAALRAALREDPDIVLVGELRDLETIAIAIETAETGHLVFGTLHTNTAASTVDRIIDQFPTDRQPQVRTMLSESLKGVVSQTLCKKVGGGRAAAQEILLCTGSVSNLIREGKTFQIPSVMQTGKAAGMQTLNDALLELVKKNVVSPEEALKKAVARTELKAAIERAGFKVGSEEKKSELRVA
jgi:twitching motility protein PilT